MTGPGLVYSISRVYQMAVWSVTEWERNQNFLEPDGQ